MKKLKKLTLKKATIVNLNGDEMNSLHGGSTYTCITWAVASYITGKIVDDIYDSYNKSKKPVVYDEGWMSRNYFQGYCCISEFEVIC